MVKEPKFKPHVGRLFRLRKVEYMEGYSVGRPSFGDGQRVLERKKQLGEIVLVIDESNTRVCVATTDGTTVWIAKYYLLKEIKSGGSKPEDVVEQVTKEILNLSTYLQGVTIQTSDGVDQEAKRTEIITQLRDMASLLRSIG